jgi:aminoglycoside phosphotransferase (APT) family kinase protein
MFKGIVESEKWIKVEQIERGWSNDDKFYIETNDNQKLILRTTSIESLQQKQKEYSIIKKYSQTGIHMSKPIGFGIDNDNQKVYMLLTWVDGENLENALMNLNGEKQYQLGREAGTILKRIHNIKVEQGDIPKQSKVDKKIKQLEKYETSNVRIKNDELAIHFIKTNIHKIWRNNPVYQHGDFHPGNLILTPDMQLGVIDFNRWEVGDPYEEFYKLESFATEVSIPYCIGQIDAYFDDSIPSEFWETLAVYVAHAALYSIKWAESFGQQEIDNMTRICRKSMYHYNDFKNNIPLWYENNYLETLKTNSK